MSFLDEKRGKMYDSVQEWIEDLNNKLGRNEKMATAQELVEKAEITTPETVTVELSVMVPKGKLGKFITSLELDDSITLNNIKIP